MTERIKALCEVGRYLGVDYMLSIVQDKETRDIYNYCKPAFANTHLASTTQENLVFTKMQEMSQYGWSIVTPLFEYCRNKAIN